MNALRPGSRLALAALLFGPLLTGFAQQPPAPQPYPSGPVPPAMVNAKSLFIANGGADSGLFPHPFSGDQNRGYDEFFAEIQRTGEYRIVSDPAQADLVLDIELQAPLGPQSPNKEYGAADPLPQFRLTVYDARSHFRLWVIGETVETAMKQETHDRNFDEAVSNLVSDFQALTHPVPQNAHK